MTAYFEEADNNRLRWDKVEFEREDEAGDTLMYVPLNGDNPSIKEGLIFKRSAGGKYFGHFKRVTRMDTKEGTKHRVEFYNLQGELESWSDIPEGRGRQQEANPNVSGRDFDCPQFGGYTYVKWRMTINRLLDLFRKIGKDSLSLKEADRLHAVYCKETEWTVVFLVDIDGNGYVNKDEVEYGVRYILYEEYEYRGAAFYKQDYLEYLVWRKELLLKAAERTKKIEEMYRNKEEAKKRRERYNPDLPYFPHYPMTMEPFHDSGKYVRQDTIGNVEDRSFQIDGGALAPEIDCGELPGVTVYSTSPTKKNLGGGNGFDNVGLSIGGKGGNGFGNGFGFGYGFSGGSGYSGSGNGSIGNTIISMSILSHSNTTIPHVASLSSTTGGEKSSFVSEDDENSGGDGEGGDNNNDDGDSTDSEDDQDDGDNDPEDPKTKPCPGDPLPEMEIAPQKGQSGLEGGMFCIKCRIEKKDGKIIRKDHKGIDIKNPYGAPVYAAYDGIATSLTQYKKGKIFGAGHYIQIISTLANGKKMRTLYFHLQKDKRASGKVKAGDIIGYQGNSGNLKEAIDAKRAESHLHYETEVGGIKVDPMPYLGTIIDKQTGKIISKKCN